MSLDLLRLRAEASFAVEFGDALSAALGSALLRILDDPSLVVPENHSLVRKPELLGKGVPARS